MSFFQSTIRQEGFHPESTALAPQDHHISYFNPVKSAASLDFTEELASLMPMDTSHERSTHQEYRPHNIFDTSSFEYPRNFNSTLPAINSSIRYDPPQPESPYSPNGFTRHTPSPQNQQQGGPQSSRSRSASRPPSGGSGGGVGPQRTTRTRRNNSVSGTSPPPTSYHHYGRPQAIVIPGRNNSNGSTPVSPLNAGPAWFGGGAATAPNPEYDISHHHFAPHHFAGNPQQYGGFGMSPTAENHLPPGMAPLPASLPKGLDMPPPNAGLPSSLPAPSTSPRAAAFSEHSPRSLTSTHHIPTSRTAAAVSAASSAQEKQLMLASEKRRRRRESHNAVERRRRDNINEKISELATLIPECMLEGGSSEAPGPTNMTTNGTPLPAEQNGGVIESLTLTMDSPPLTSPTSPLSQNPLTANEENVDLWGDLAPPATSSSSSTNANPIPKKENLDGLTLYPIGEDDAAAAANAGTPSTPTAGGNPSVKANKGMILRKSVEYIRYLQQLVKAQGVRNRELEDELRGYRSGYPNGDGAPSSHSSIGMGMAMGMGGMGAWAYTSTPTPTPQTATNGGTKNGGDEDDKESPLSDTSPSSTDDHDDSSANGGGAKKTEQQQGNGDGETLVSRGRKRTTKFGGADRPIRRNGKSNRDDVQMDHSDDGSDMEVS